MDDPDDQTPAATLIQDDQIDFLDCEGTENYRDELSTDDDVDAFTYTDQDEEEAIGLNHQLPRR